MPRYARQSAPGALVHIISRFVNRDHRLTSDAERAAVLARIPLALARTDWRMHGYSLMSSHLHLAMTAGNAPPEAFLKPLLTSVARHLNWTQGRFGPVFGDRATTLLMPPDRMAALLAYLHNNPARAGLVVHPSHTSWSSHRMWVGLDVPAPWLAVEAGLRHAGFDVTAEGRRAFDEFVLERVGDPRDPDWTSAALARTRRAVRRETALPVEISGPRLPKNASHAPRVEVVHVGCPPVERRWEGDLQRLVAAVSRWSGVPIAEIRSRTHRPGAVRARRLVVVVGAWILRRQMNELASTLTISCPSASRLLRGANALLPDAVAIAAEVRTEVVKS